MRLFESSKTVLDRKASRVLSAARASALLISGADMVAEGGGEGVFDIGLLGAPGAGSLAIAIVARRDLRE